MILTLDLTATEEARLSAAARQQGVAPEALLKKLVNTLPPSPESEAMLISREQERIAAIHEARGSLAHVGVAVEDLHRERQTDKQAEEQQIPRRLP